MRLLLEFICFVTFARCETKINVGFPELRNGSKVIASQTKGGKFVTEIEVSHKYQLCKWDITGDLRATITFRSYGGEK